jgi:nitrate reductase NapE component
MGKDKSDYIAPLDSYNLTIAFAPVFMIIIISMIATGIIFGFNPIVDITISWTASIFIYMVIKNVVLVELELRKFRNKWKSGMRGKEDRQDDINDESYYSDSSENLGYLVITIVHFLILGIVLKTIYGFLLLAYPLIAFSSCALVCSVVEYLRYYLKKKHRSKRRS